MNEPTPGNNDFEAPMPPPETGLPFQPAPGESPEAFEGFLCYWELGPKRTCEKVAHILELNPSTIREWSAKFGWTQRIRHYRLQLYRVHRQAQDTRSKDMALAEAQGQERCATLGNLCLKLGENILNYILQTSPDKVTATEAIRLMDLGDKLVKSARSNGDPEKAYAAETAALRESLQAAIDWVASQKKAAAAAGTQLSPTPSTST